MQPRLISIIAQNFGRSVILGARKRTGAARNPETKKQKIHICISYLVSFMTAASVLLPLIDAVGLGEVKKLPNFTFSQMLRCFNMKLIIL